jgi:hypothetical protein
MQWCVQATTSADVCPANDMLGQIAARDPALFLSYLWRPLQVIPRLKRTPSLDYSVARNGVTFVAEKIEI